MFSDPVYDTIDFILTYVPEVEWLTLEQAFDLAVERDREAAEILQNTIEGGAYE